MKNMRMRLMGKLFLLSAILFLSGCHVSAYYVNTNQEINDKDRNDISKMVNGICTDMYDLKNSYILSITGENDKSKMENTVNLMYKHVRFNKQDIIPLDQFLIKNSSDLKINTVSSPEHGYIYQFEPGAMSYIYLVPLKTKNEKYTWLMSCVFNKENDEWKLSNLYLGFYTINGKTTEDFYGTSKKELSAGKLLSAF